MYINEVLRRLRQALSDFHNSKDINFVSNETDEEFRVSVMLEMYLPNNEFLKDHAVAEATFGISDSDIVADINSGLTVLTDIQEIEKDIQIKISIDISDGNKYSYSYDI